MRALIALLICVLVVCPCLAGRRAGSTYRKYNTGHYDFTLTNGSAQDFYLDTDTGTQAHRLIY